MNIEDSKTMRDREREEMEELAMSGMENSWTKQITLRGIVASVIIGIMFSFVSMKLYLTVGMAPHFNVSAALFAFIFIKSWTKILEKAGITTKPFTRQENTMIQTSVVACYTLAIGGGLGSYLLALNKKTYELAGSDNKANNSNSYKEPGYGWMTVYLFLVSIVGLFVLVPLRKILIVDMKLIFPSGMSTAVLINSFHGGSDKDAKMQLGGFLKCFSFSFVWGCIKWFFEGKGKGCGFENFPAFGLQAAEKTFSLDFNATFVGGGMLVSPIVSLSMLLGAILSSGIMWPFIRQRKGDWYPADLSESSFRSLTGYKTFLSISLILGDGLYTLVKVMGITLINVHQKMNDSKIERATSGDHFSSSQFDDQKPRENLNEDEYFIRDKIPLWISVMGYITLSILSTIMVPILFPQVKWYYVAVSYIVAPTLAFCNAYGAGLTDQNMSNNYANVVLFMLAALSGPGDGVVAALAGCGVIKSVIYVACNLMHDFKTAHLTYTSTKAMFLTQVFGTVIGCVTSPASFFLFYKAFDVGNPNGEFKAPLAILHRNMAILGVQGFSALPKYCLEFCYVLFVVAILINLVRDLSPWKIGKWMPLPMIVAVPFIIGANLAIDMTIGSLIVIIWKKRSPANANLLVSAVASGIVCGEGLWSLPAAILSLANIKPPICMNFVPS